MAATDSATALGWLRAAGEDSRLRLLALCARQELSVSDLAEALRQSEPRVSRHLRILCEAGLLERLRQGQWVHYRLTHNVAAASFVQGLLGQLDGADPVFVRDRGRVLAQTRGAASAAVTTGAGRGVGTGGGAAGMGGASSLGRSTGARTLESRLGRALKGFVEAVDVAVADIAVGRGAIGTAGGGVAERPKSALVVGVEHLELLETAAFVAGECVAIAHSRRAAQSAREFAHRRGFACRTLLAASPNALCEKDILAAGAPFDVVFLDHLAVPGSALEAMLTYGRRTLAAAGQLWLFERYESLASSRAKVVEHPIGRLRRLLGDVGLSCQRLSPIEADGEHVLAAVAVPARSVARGTGTTSAA
ncbi:MAG: ArsR/SmtB family transcription factor [Steroidobacteraceae bacterium]